MDFFNIGDTIGYSQYNAIVYLLRKFKRLTSKLRLGQSIINDNYGTYNIIGGLTSIEGNGILEDDVQIISNDCLLNCKYAFTFTVVDVNTSGTVNKREITFNGNTGDTGELNINIPSDSISSDEQILSDFRLDIVLDIHEYYTRPVGINVALSVDKPYISGGESATVTALLTDDDGTPIESHTVNFDVNGTITSKTTDSTGKATLTITGDGTQGLLDIKVMNETITIMDAYFFDENNNENWWNQNGDWNVSINSNGSKHLLLTSNMERSYLASTTPSIDSAPPLNELLSIPTPFCVEFDTDTVNYPNNIPSFVLWDTQGNMVFKFQLFMFKHYKIQIEDNTIKIWTNNEYIEYSLEIPEELYVGFYSESNKFNAYVDFKDFMIYNLSEPEPPAHDYSLSVAGTSIIETGDFTTVTATLLDNGVAVDGETLSYEIKHGSSTIDSGSDTTDSNGEIEIEYIGTGVGDVDVIVSFGMSLQETYELQDCHFIDDASTDKSSSYVAKTLGTHLISNSISYANNEYTVSSNVDSTAWTGVNPSVSLSTEDNWVFSAKVKSKAFPSIGLGDGVQKHIEMIRYPLNGNWAVYGYISPNSYLVSNKSLSNSSNTYYTHEISLENGLFTFKIYDTNGNLLDSATAQLPSVYENSTVYPVISTFPNGNDQRSITFKDVKIKAL